MTLPTVWEVEAELRGIGHLERLLFLLRASDLKPPKVGYFLSVQVMRRARYTQAFRKADLPSRI